MLQFTYKLKLTERVKAKCCRHPRYNPEKDGRAGIRGGCSTCSPSTTSTRPALHSMQRSGSSYAELGRGYATRTAPEGSFD